jgi:hypothetical protein
MKITMEQNECLVLLMRESKISKSKFHEEKKEEQGWVAAKSDPKPEANVQILPLL